MGDIPANRGRGGRHLEINRDDYQCEYQENYFADTIDTLTSEEQSIVWYLFDLRVPEWVTFTNVFFQESGDFPSRKIERAFARELRQLQRFWKMNDYRITLQAVDMHQLKDEDLMLRALTDPLIGMVEDEAIAMLAEVNGIMQDYPAIGYDFPLWTWTAFASAESAYYYPDRDHGASLSYGHGMFAFNEALSLSPTQVLYHEYAHHIIFDLDPAVPFYKTPEENRYLELLADAFASYYAHHPKGGNVLAFESFDASEQIIQTAFVGGDCSFRRPGHHGTPNQRRAAVEFGAGVANEMISPTVSNYDFWFYNRRQNPLSTVEFKALFDDVFPKLVAPDNF